MRALTLHQPWAWAVAHAGKDYENRGWPPPAGIIGRRIAIHAGKHLDTNALAHLRGLGITTLEADDFARGAIVATVIVTGWDGWSPKHVDTARRPSKWFTGPYGWRLRECRALAEPVPCRGAQGLWTLPPDVEAEVLRKIGETP